MRIRTGLWIAMAAAAAIGCAELVGPLRPAGYAFEVVASSVVVADTTVDGTFYPADSVVTDTVWFHWPTTSLPVRIWVDSGGGLGLPGHIEDGIALWKKVLQYGEYDAVVVSDSLHADVIVLAGPPPGSVAPRVRMEAMASQCSGATDIAVSNPDHHKFLLPVHIYIENKFPADEDSTQTCLGLTAAHELGHSMGLFQHSSDPNDLMYAFPIVTAPSAADAWTVLYLYHVRPDLVPVFLPAPPDSQTTLSPPAPIHG